MPSSAARIRPGLIFQHGPLGPPGVLGEWLAARGLPFELREAWHDGGAADPGAYAWIASLGSPHLPTDAAPAWVPEEVTTIRAAVDRGVPVLGLCFGGQALAVALGGEMRDADPPEVGWLPVQTRDPARIPPGPWLQFHWHAMTLPDGAQELARSPGGLAAFRAGPHLGTQFHPEATPEIVEGWTQVEERLPAVGVDPAAMLADGRRRREASRAAAFALFDAWAADALGA